MVDLFVEPTIKFCESNLSSLIAQPANTWSNLLYLIIGIFLFLLALKNKQSILFGVIVFLIGLTSLIYHATFTFLGQLLDLGSMYLFISYLIAFNIQRLNLKRFIVKPVVVVISITTINLLIVYFIRTINNFNIGIPVFSIQLILFLLLEFWLYFHRVEKYRLINLVIAVIIFAFAWIFWILDYTRVWCNQNTFHLINGHVLWHVVNSFSFIFIYLHFSQFGKKLLIKN